MLTAERIEQVNNLSSDILLTKDPYVAIALDRTRKPQLRATMALTALTMREPCDFPTDSRVVTWSQTAYALATTPDINQIITPDTMSSLRTKMMDTSVAEYNKTALAAITTYSQEANQQGEKFQARTWLLSTADRRLTESKPERFDKATQAERDELHGKIKRELALVPETDFTWRAKLHAKAADYRQEGNASVAAVLEDLSDLPIDADWEEKLEALMHDKRKETLFLGRKEVELSEPNLLYEVVMPLVTQHAEGSLTPYGHYREAKRFYTEAYNLRLPPTLPLDASGAVITENETHKPNTQVMQLESGFYSAAMGNFIAYIDAQRATEQEIPPTQRAALKKALNTREKLASAYIERKRYAEALCILDQIPNSANHRELRTMTDLYLAQESLKTSNSQKAQKYTREALKSSLALETISDETGRLIRETLQQYRVAPEVSSQLHILQARYDIGKAKRLSEELTAAKTRSIAAQLTVEGKERQTLYRKQLKTANEDLRRATGADPTSPEKAITAVKKLTPDEKIRQSLYLALTEYSDARIGQFEKQPDQIKAARNIHTYADALEESLLATVSAHHAHHAENRAKDVQEVLSRVWTMQVHAETTADPHQVNIPRMRQTAKMMETLQNRAAQAGVNTSDMPVNAEIAQIQTGLADADAAKRIQNTLKRVAANPATATSEDFAAVATHAPTGTDSIHALSSIYDYLKSPESASHLSLATRADTLTGVRSKLIEALNIQYATLKDQVDKKKVAKAAMILSRLEALAEEQVLQHPTLPPYVEIYLRIHETKKR